MFIYACFVFALLFFKGTRLKTCSHFKVWGFPSFRITPECNTPKIKPSDASMTDAIITFLFNGSLTLRFTVRQMIVHTVHIIRIINKNSQLFPRNPTNFDQVFWLAALKRWITPDFADDKLPPACADDKLPPARADDELPPAPVASLSLPVSEAGPERHPDRTNPINTTRTIINSKYFFVLFII